MNQTFKLCNPCAAIRNIYDDFLDSSIYSKGYIGKRVHGHADTDRRTRTHGHGHLWKRRADMERTGSYGKDGQLWKRRTLMEKTGTYGKDGQLWKRRTLMEKTDTYGKDGHKAFQSINQSINQSNLYLKNTQSFQHKAGFQKRCVYY